MRLIYHEPIQKSARNAMSDQPFQVTIPTQGTDIQLAPHPDNGSPSSSSASGDDNTNANFYISKASIQSDVDNKQHNQSNRE